MNAATKPLSVHQRGCSTRKCGGTFTCTGCQRRVGWCLGCADKLGPEHCDACFTDRLAVLEGVKRGCNNRFMLASNARANLGWLRPPVTVARELCIEGFLVFKRNGAFYLTDRGREALG